MLVSAVLLGAWRPGAAFADADPASDVLLAQSVFYPYQPRTSRSVEVALNTVLRSAAQAGLALKVAVIGSSADLGAVPDFFGHPQAYAQFLDKEIAYNNRPSLLVVMPAGFGVVAAGPESALAGVKVDKSHGSDGLALSAIAAIVALAHARGKTISTPPMPSGPSGGGGPPTALLFAVPAALVIVVGLLGLRRRRAQRDVR